MTNRLTAAAVKGLFAVSMLFAGVSSLAQTPGNLYLTYNSQTQASGPGPFTVTAGQSLQINGMLSPALAAAGGTNPKTSGVQTIILYDPTFFSPDPTQTAGCANSDACGSGAPTSSNPFSTLLTQSAVTFTIGSTNYAGIIYDAGQLTGQKTYTSPITFANYFLQVNAGASGISTVYYSTYNGSQPASGGGPFGLTAAQLSTATNVVAPDASPTPSGSALVSQASYNPNSGYGGGSTTFTNGLIQFEVSSATPAPPSLLLFAAGTVPALRMIRRKRRA